MLLDILGSKLCIGVRDFTSASSITPVLRSQPSLVTGSALLVCLQIYLLVPNTPSVLRRNQIMVSSSLFCLVTESESNYPIPERFFFLSMDL